MEKVVKQIDRIDYFHQNQISFEFVGGKYIFCTEISKFAPILHWEGKYQRVGGGAAPRLLDKFLNPKKESWDLTILNLLGFRLCPRRNNVMILDVLFRIIDR